MSFKTSIFSASVFFIVVTPLLSAPQGGNLISTREVRAAEAFCLKLLGRARADPGWNSWKNRTKLWRCYRAWYPDRPEVALAGHVRLPVG